MTETNWTYGTHQIRVVTTVQGGARLYVDAELLDTTNDLYSSEDEPTLLGTFGELFVEAFVPPVVVRPSIRVNGEWVGNETLAAAS